MRQCLPPTIALFSASAELLEFPDAIFPVAERKLLKYEHLTSLLLNIYGLYKIQMLKQ